LLTAAAVRVSRWVSTPMTPSTSSASMGIVVVLLVWGRPWSVSAWEESPRGRTVMGHNPRRVGQAADQASVVGQADAGTTADSSDLKATELWSKAVDEPLA
jgi:hypothetical protein